MLMLSRLESGSENLGQGQWRASGDFPVPGRKTKNTHAFCSALAGNFRVLRGRPGVPPPPRPSALSWGLLPPRPGYRPLDSPGSIQTTLMKFI